MFYTRNKLLSWLGLVLIWWAAFALFFMIRFSGWDVVPNLDFDPKQGEVKGMPLFLGVVVGTLYFCIELIMTGRRLLRLPFAQWVMVKSLMHLLLVVFFFVVAIFVYSLYDQVAFDRLSIRWLIFSKFFLIILIYFSVVSAGISLFIQMNQKLGKGILKNMVIGRYHRPRQEERIFLFIDLKDSTPIAERLGHVRYSLLIQDCFADITGAVLRHEAEIYQYVGDEVVLTWRADKGLYADHCIRAYFDFQHFLEKRKEYYQSTYGLTPFFKAGAHIGTTTVTEVGIIKRELAYHGEVLNTAARIQSRCNSLRQSMLISSQLARALDLSQGYREEVFPTQTLSGVGEAVSLVGLTETGPEGSSPVDYPVQRMT